MKKLLMLLFTALLPTLLAAEPFEAPQRNSAVFSHGRLLPGEVFSHMCSFLGTEDLFNVRRAHPDFNYIIGAFNKPQIFGEFHYSQHERFNQHPHPNMVKKIIHINRFAGQGAFCALLDQFPNLEVLTAAYKLREKGLLHINNLKKLKELLLRFQPFTTSKILGSLVESHHLQVLDLEGCYQVTDEVVMKLSHNASKLRSLGLGGCHELTDKGISALSRAPQLRKLILSNIKNITSNAIIALKDLSLSTLNLYGCRNISETAIMALANSPTLEELSLGGCPSIFFADATVSILANLPNLKILRLNNNYHFSNRGLYLLRNSSSLKFLNIAHCPMLTMEMVSLFQEERPDIKLVFLG